MVPESRLRELFHARIAVRGMPPLADLTSKKATGWGINAEMHTALDYRKPRAWAATLRAAGARGLRYLLRSDPSLRSKAVALFGAAGLHARAPVGMHTAVTPLDLRQARPLLEARGVLVVPIPRDVAVVAPAKR